MEDSIKHLSFEILLKYLFGELPDTANEEVAQMLLADEYHYELVQNLMHYCEQNDIHDRVSLEQAIEHKKLDFFTAVDQKSIDRKKKPTDPTASETKVVAHPNSFVFKYRRQIAAVFLLALAGALTWYFWPDQRMPLATLVNPMLQPYEMTRATKTIDIKQLYEQGEYEKVRQIIEKDLPNKAGYDKAEATLILANCFIFSAQQQEAIPILEQLLPQHESIQFRSEIRWYLAMAHSMDQNPHEVKKYLTALINDGKYHQQATALLTLLKTNGY